MEWPRGSGNPLARLLGVLHNKFRILDRHQPRGNADLGNPATRECDLAAAGDAVCRGHHRLRSDDRSDVPDHSSRAAVAFLLAHPVSERTANLAEPAIAAGVGLLCDFDIPDREHPVPVTAAYSRFRAPARSDEGMAEENLCCPCPGVARHDKAVASAGSRNADHGNCHCAGCGIRPHDRVFRLFDVVGADVALHGLWSILRRGRNLQRNCGADSGDGSSSQGFASGRVFASRPFSKSWKAVAHDEPALGLLYIC